MRSLLRGGAGSGPSSSEALRFLGLAWMLAVVDDEASLSSLLELS